MLVCKKLIRYCFLYVKVGGRPNNWKVINKKVVSVPATHDYKERGVGEVDGGYRSYVVIVHMSKVPR